MAERCRRRAVGVTALAFVAVLARLDRVAQAQVVAPPAVPVDDLGTLADRVWISYQANVIYQQSGGLTPQPDRATSAVETLYAGVRLTKPLEVLGDIETAAGSGLNGASALGANSNVDVPRDLRAVTPHPYVARAMLHYTLALGAETTLVTRNPLSLAPVAAVRRLEIRAGKMSAVDYFDLNAVGSDGHSQFINAAIVNNGAYDYVGDSRGYSYGVVAEYYDRSWAVRFGQLTSLARSENLEVEYHTTAPLNRPSVIRALAFRNHASSISESGWGINAEHQLTDVWRAFWRVGRNDGATAATPVNVSVAAGADLRGQRWHRAADKIGAALTTNGLSRPRAQLAGGGASRYANEHTLETYYTAQLWKRISLAVTGQLVAHPAYDRGRGVAGVLGFRVHIEDVIPIEIKE